VEFRSKKYRGSSEELKSGRNYIPIDAAELALEAIQTLSHDVGIPRGLKELGVKEEDLKTMAENAQNDACGFTNPRCPSLEEVINVYKAAM
jgi:alcohol dehydrogenase